MTLLTLVVFDRSKGNQGIGREGCDEGNFTRHRDFDLRNNEVVGLFVQ